MPKHETKLSEDRDALGYNVRVVCEEPIMRIEQVAHTLCLVYERILGDDPAAADAVTLAESTLSREVEALRHALRLSSAGQEGAQ